MSQLYKNAQINVNVCMRGVCVGVFPPNYPWVDKNRIKVPLGRQFFLKQTSA